MSESTSAAVVPGAPLTGTAGRGGGASSQHPDSAELDLTEGSDPPPGAPPASDSDCGSPGASRPPVAVPVQTRG